MTQLQYKPSLSLFTSAWVVFHHAQYQVGYFVFPKACSSMTSEIIV